LKTNPFANLQGTLHKLKNKEKIPFFGKLFLKWTYRNTSIFKQFKKSANTHCQAENNSPHQCRTLCTFSQLNDEIQGVTFLKKYIRFPRTKIFKATGD